MRNNKGFTLMEMLIVVAIIAILIAIAIPAFSNQLEIAREAADLANIRNGYAELVVTAMLGDGSKSYIREFKDNTTKQTYAYCMYIKTRQKIHGWQTTNFEMNKEGYVKMNEAYITAPYKAGGVNYNVYQLLYYIDEQPAKAPANPTPYHFKITVIKEDAIDKKTGFYAE